MAAVPFSTQKHLGSGGSGPACSTLASDHPHSPHLAQCLPTGLLRDKRDLASEAWGTVGSCSLHGVGSPGAALGRESDMPGPGVQEGAGRSTCWRPGPRSL